MNILNTMNTLIQMDYLMIISLVFDGDVLLMTSICLTYCMVSKWYDVGFIVDAVLFDFAKAFDVVSYHMLCRSRLLGIYSSLIDCIADFLIGCITKVSGIRSSFMDISSGVPQVHCFFFFLLISFFLYTECKGLYISGSASIPAPCNLDP